MELDEAGGAGSDSGRLGRASAVAVGDPPARQIIGRKLDLYAIAEQDADVVAAHLAGEVGQHRVVVVQLDAKLRRRQGLDDGALHLDLLLGLRHPRLRMALAAREAELALAPLPRHLSLPALEPPDGFLLLDSPQFALGDEPALAAYRAQDSALGHLLADPFYKPHPFLLFSPP